MKQLIAGIFLVQILIIAALGIPADGAANAIWKDENTGVVVRQNNPENTVKSFYSLLQKEGYDAAVLLFEEEQRANINSNLLKDYTVSSKTDTAKIVNTFASGEIGDIAVVGTVLKVNLEENGEQALVSMLTLKKNNGKWEIVQDFNNADMQQVKMVFEHAICVSNDILKDPLDGLNQEQRDTVKMQVEMGRQYLLGSVEQINSMMEMQK